MTMLYLLILLVYQITVIVECQTYFSFKLPSTLLAERVKKLKGDDDLGHCG